MIVMVMLMSIVAAAAQDEGVAWVKLKEAEIWLLKRDISILRERPIQSQSLAWQEKELRAALNEIL